MSVVTAVRTAERARRPRRARFEIDLALLVGIVAFFALVVLALYGPLVAPHDFWYSVALLNGQPPPYPPGTAFPLGTDEAGHDLLSWVLIGARSTLTVALAAALLRMLVGGFLGVFAAWQGGWKETLLSRAALAFSSLPATIAAAAVVIAFNVYSGALGFTLALGLLGWADAFHHARRRARAEAARPFIESARMLGMSESRVVLRHLIPGLGPALLTLAALQVSAVLLLMGELGLIRLAMGGIDVLDYDRYGLPRLTLPAQPDWSSMLAATRPVTSIYGASWTVLVPGLALLAAVVGTNLLGDGLARRAQQLDVYRLFSRRQLAVLAALILILVVPVLLWPSRLAPELGRARGLSGAAAVTTAVALDDARFDGRVAGTSGAHAAATEVAGRLGGEVVAAPARSVSLESASLSVNGETLAPGPDFTPLSLRDVSVSGALLDFARRRRIGPGASTGHFVVSAGPTNVSSSLQFPALQSDAVGVIIVSEDDGRVRPSAEEFSVPTVRISPEAFRNLAGSLPLQLDPNASDFDDRVLSLSIRVSARPVDAYDVIARVAGTDAAAPVLLVIGPYDTPPVPHYLDRAHDPGEAGAIGAMVEVAAALRAAPLRSEVVFLATGADALDRSGLRAGLARLSAQERARLATVLRLGRLGNAAPVVLLDRPASTLSTASDPGTRVGGRVANELGLRTRAEDLGLRGVIRTLDATPSMIFGLEDRSAAAATPNASALATAERALLVLLAYVSDHPGELTQ